MSSLEWWAIYSVAVQYAEVRIQNQNFGKKTGLTFLNKNNRFLRILKKNPKYFYILESIIDAINQNDLSNLKFFCKSELLLISQQFIIKKYEK